MPPDSTATGDVLTIAEVATRLRIGRNGAYEAAKRGDFPVLQIGRRLLVPRAAFERWLVGNGPGVTGGEAGTLNGRRP